MHFQSSNGKVCKKSKNFLAEIIHFLFFKCSKLKKEQNHHVQTTHFKLSSRVIQEISDCFVVGLRWQMNAVHIIHDVCEVYLTSLFTDSNLVAIHAGHVTVNKKDIELVRRLRGETE